MNKVDIRSVFKNILLFVTFVFLVVIIFGSLQWFFDSLYGFFEKKAALNQKNFLASVTKTSDSQNLLPYRNWQVEDLKIDAESSISVETNLSLQKKVLFKKSETKILPISHANTHTTFITLKSTTAQTGYGPFVFVFPLF